MGERIRKKVNLTSRAQRTRAHIRTTSDRPRLSVHISNSHIMAQIIDDAQSKTLASASTIGITKEGNMTARAATVGKLIAEAAKKAKISKVVFDRGNKKYHGRIKALADAARKNGLEF